MRDFFGIVLVLTSYFAIMGALIWISGYLLALGGPIAVVAFVILMISTIIFVLTR